MELITLDAEVFLSISTLLWLIAHKHWCIRQRSSVLAILDFASVWLMTGKYTFIRKGEILETPNVTKLEHRREYFDNSLLFYRMVLKFFPGMDYCRSKWHNINASNYRTRNSSKWRNEFWNVCRWCSTQHWVWYQGLMVRESVRESK